MKFETYFRALSYAVVLSGFFALWVTGGFGLFISAGFLGAVGLSLILEKKGYQFSERAGTILVVIAVPLFYLGWKYRIFGYTDSESMVAGLLGRLILGLTVIKLFQKKSDRDWLFLYLMAFFEVLLGAALSISPLYLVAILIFLFSTTLAIIASEIRKSARLVVSPRGGDGREERLRESYRPMPATAVIILVLVASAAIPMFFMLPRVGGAGFGGGQSGISGMTGFSDRVSLGEIGRIQQSDEVVMRVRVDSDESGAGGGMKWRGVALDTFDHKVWSKARPLNANANVINDNDAFLVEYASGKAPLTYQTFYLEPMDTDVLFGMPRIVAVSAGFPSIRRDSYGGITAARRNYDRTTYKIVSDRWLPPINALRKDDTAYPASFASYLTLPPDMDERITALSDRVTAGKSNRYDRARAIENFLQNEFGYTLEQKSSGPQPVADFLFNVREGHCEYFATSMVLMLRTQGIAARIVNGFQTGEFNETSGMYVVRQRDAHAWVEVYFPKEGAWVAFDPTPFAGQNISGGETGVMNSLSRYMDALEALWIQYFVSFDDQEQQSLFKSVKTGFVGYQEQVSAQLNELQERLKLWWNEVRGDRGLATSALAVGRAVLYLGAFAAIAFFVWRIGRRAARMSLFASVSEWLRRRRNRSPVEFYARMERVLAKRGFTRRPDQTPLEFAFALNMPLAVKLTEKYNGVRFGNELLAPNDASAIEAWLDQLERGEPDN